MLVLSRLTGRTRDQELSKWLIVGLMSQALTCSGSRSKVPLTREANLNLDFRRRVRDQHQNLHQRSHVRSVRTLTSTNTFAGRIYLLVFQASSWKSRH